MSEELIAGLTHGQLEQVAMDVKRFNDMYRCFSSRPTQSNINPICGALACRDGRGSIFY